ncbi:MAG: cyclic pyranopterin monophosphate synthase MoaC [Clostridiaceae bacterium]|jgi:cyclic pyranopterin phosphate synthase|nr:cyclic pyranopterin monophosphate synthase MoaC [Clostridiaceae bacterium]
MDLSHINKDGSANMVDVSKKSITMRTARAEAKIVMKPETLERVTNGGIRKGDVMTIAEIAGIAAAKKTSELIPLCHNIPLNHVKVEFKPLNDTEMVICAEVSATAVTGVEMEALTAVSVAALTVYDMVKSIDKDVLITDIRLLEKTGGKSGHYLRNADNPR